MIRTDKQRIVCDVNKLIEARQEMKLLVNEENTH